MRDIDTVALVWLHRRVKMLAAGLILFVCSSCMTLENRRDLYSSDPEIYWHPRAHTVRETTTTTTRTVAPIPAIPEQDDVAPPGR
ncbi:MAG: hypothetical protein ABI795_05500 [Chthoniobacterales bacterium]